jgi:curli biogenesis system outer membrane secretion channel CsgG
MTAPACSTTSSPRPPARSPPASSARSIAVASPPRKAAGNVTVNFTTELADLYIPDVRIDKDNTVRMSEDKLKVSAVATIEVDGLAVGTAPGKLTVKPGLHKLRVVREGYKPWERTVNFTNGQTLNVGLEMSEAGYARWKESTAFINDLKNGAKLTDGQVKVLEGQAKMFENSGFKVNTKEGITINAGPTRPSSAGNPPTSQPPSSNAMKSGRILLSLLTALVLLAPATRAQEATGKKKLAITKMVATPSLTARMQKQGVGLSLESVMEALDSQVHDRVLNTRRFEILERSDADALATEAAASGGAFAFNKADYVMTIRVDSFNDRMEERKLASLGKTIRARVIELSAVAKITEVATQRAVASANFKVSKRDSENRSENTTERVGEASDDLMIQAVAEMAQKIAVRAADVVSPARVIGKRDKTVTINRNDQSGIEVGQTWEVYMLGDELVDPDTGEKSREEVLVGKVKVTRVTPQNSQAEILEDTGIDRGAVVRLVAGEDES